MLTRPTRATDFIVPGGTVGLAMGLQEHHLDRSRLRKAEDNDKTLTPVPRSADDDATEATSRAPSAIEQEPDLANAGPPPRNEQKNKHSQVVPSGGLRRPKNAVSELGYSMAIDTVNSSTPPQVQDGAASRPASPVYAKGPSNNAAQPWRTDERAYELPAWTRR